MAESVEDHQWKWEFSTAEVLKILCGADQGQRIDAASGWATRLLAGCVE